MIDSRWLGALALAGAASVHAQPLPTAAPESVGMSSERLRRIETFFAGEIERNRVSGAVVAIARLLAAPLVRYLHRHNSKLGCYSCLVRRAP